MVLLVMLVVVTRYFLEVGSIALQEAVTYLHCLVFLMGLAFTLKHDGHVRVDIFYRGATAKYKDLINVIFGFIFLLPLAFVVGFYSIELINMSWKIQETSTEAGGLPYVFVQKTFILLFPLTLFAAFFNQLIKTIWK